MRSGQSRHVKQHHSAAADPNSAAARDLELIEQRQKIQRGQTMRELLG